MSKRNSLESKRERKALRALRVSPPGYIDLVEWIRMRSNVTRSTARAILASGAIHSDSHVVGQLQLKSKDGQVRRILASPIIEASHRPDLHVVTPEGLDAA